MKRGTDRGYLPDPAKYLFILDTTGQEEVARREFAPEGLDLNFVSGSRYLEAYMGPEGELAAWVKPQVEAWAQEVRVLHKKSPMTPPVGLCRIENVGAIRGAVPVKYCP